MVFNIELLSIGEDRYRDLEEAASTLNAVQKEFQFDFPPTRLRGFGTPFVQSEYVADDVFALLSRYRVEAKGHRPYLIGVVEARLRSHSLANLFGSHRAEEGVAVVTLWDALQFAPTLVSYIRYYLVRYALSFVEPSVKSHQETRGCFFDRKEYKRDLLKSMESGNICDECRKKILGSFNEEIHCAMVRLVLEVKKATTSVSAMESRQRDPFALVKHFAASQEVPRQPEATLTTQPLLPTTPPSAAPLIAPRAHRENGGAFPIEHDTETLANEVRAGHPVPSQPSQPVVGGPLAPGVGGPLAPGRDLEYGAFVQELRNQLDERFPLDEEFDAFCLTYFPKVEHEFSASMARTRKYNLLMKMVDPAAVKAALAASGGVATAPRAGGNVAGGEGASAAGSAGGGATGGAGASDARAGAAGSKEVDAAGGEAGAGDKGADAAGGKGAGAGGKGAGVSGGNLKPPSTATRIVVLIVGAISLVVGLILGTHLCRSDGMIQGANILVALGLGALLTEVPGSIRIKLNLLEQLGVGAVGGVGVFIFVLWLKPFAASENDQKHCNGGSGGSSTSVSGADGATGTTGSTSIGSTSNGPVMDDPCAKPRFDTGGASFQVGTGRTTKEASDELTRLKKLFIDSDLDYRWSQALVKAQASGGQTPYVLRADRITVPSGRALCRWLRECKGNKEYCEVVP